MVALLQHGAPAHAEVAHVVATAQQRLQLSRIATLRGHIDAHAVGDAVTDACHAHGIFMRQSERVQPGGEVAQHLVVILELDVHAEAVSARGIDVERAVVSGTAHG